MFRRQLRRNLRLKLRSFALDWSVEETVGLYLVHVPPGDEATAHIPRIVEGLRQVFGVVWLTSAWRLPAYRFTPASQADDLAEISQRVVELASRQFVSQKTFCVRVNRGNKLLPFKSTELAAHLGQIIRDHTKWQTVNLHRPDVTFHLDLRTDATFLFGERLKGPGGLPVGTSGRALALFSGGIDSPVAAYLMAKRGCRIDFLHFTATHTDPEEILRSKIGRLARHLCQYTLGARLFVVPYTHFDLALLGQKLDYQLVLFRRFMFRVAEFLARRSHARALVTGDNLSQVASQTMTNLVSASQASDLLILRPIVAFDKEETIALAEKIGTYEISIECYKDCCALISGHPKTRSDPDRVAQLEAKAFPNYPTLIERTLADGICLELPVALATSVRPALPLLQAIAPKDSTPAKPI